MAERRMFAKTIIDSDAFLDMPVTAQLLYFHLAMRADDDGFVNKPKTIMRMTGCKDDDINLLFFKKFLKKSGILFLELLDDQSAFFGILFLYQVDCLIHSSEQRAALSV